jgi:hypothetical protein
MIEPQNGLESELRCDSEARKSHFAANSDDIGRAEKKQMLLSTLKQ